MGRTAPGLLLVIGVSTSALAQTPTWKQLTANGATASPPPRSFFGMTYDERLGGTVIFGGQGASDLNDTWVWNGARWALLSDGGAPGAPSPRYAVAMGFDRLRARTVMFGGYVTGGTSNIGGETWELGPDGGWALVQSETLATPPARAFAAMAHDLGSKAMILTGGTLRSATAGADTWSWDGLTWKPLSADGGPATDEGGMVYDGARGEDLYYGGAVAGGYSSTLSEWSASTGWSSLGTGSPGERARFGMAFDVARKRTVLFGGINMLGLIQPGDTWEWDGAQWFHNPGGTGPGALDGAGMAFDCKRGVSVLFGGNDFTGNVNATWEYGVVDPSDGGWLPGVCPALARPDAGAADAGGPADSGSVDAGSPDAGSAPMRADLGGCGCGAGDAGLGYLTALLMGSVRARRRRRPRPAGRCPTSGRRSPVRRPG